ncbi:uncharacterized protein MONBRDRAFT_28451 [Monosiga brevicollis MX1]|uniref:N-acetylgalactosaminide beta-1,3-galactosyltransferase n=1 Tax=Monosiga brevicollis TaxID=81824 RepID=A9V876_MONBE|nr:uncharacterized protein MONBRDRAFT_28451 [Monosiga brevicollis MX1]EDQ86290.1 predicted protein [Monosiga brevicollis MX1]|eukprot:XP_001748960.1 hypothetical protein [Monosiga brevicollis MX1]
MLKKPAKPFAASWLAIAALSMFGVGMLIAFQAGVRTGRSRFLVSFAAPAPINSPQRSAGPRALRAQDELIEAPLAASQTDDVCPRYASPFESIMWTRANLAEAEAREEELRERSYELVSHAQDLSHAANGAVQHIINDLIQAHQEIRQINTQHRKLANNVKALTQSLSANNKRQAAAASESDSTDLTEIVQQLRDVLRQRANTEHAADVSPEDLQGALKDMNDSPQDSAEEDQDGFWETDAPVQPGQIRVARSATCLDGYDSNRLIVYNCNSKIKSQYWTFHQGRIITHSDQCLDTAAVEVGAVVRLAQCDATKSTQQWEIKAFDNFAWNVSSQIRTAQGDLCLTAPRPYDEDIASRSCSQLWHVHALAVPQQQVDPDRAHDDTVHAHQLRAAIARNPMQTVWTPADRRGARIFCWIMTNPANHGEKAVAVERTWGRHCDKLVFVTTEEDAAFPTWLATLPSSESRAMLWRKSKYAWLRAYREELNHFDWFIRGDDDTYMMMDNVGHFLQQYDAAETHYFGRRFLFTDLSLQAKIPFYSGGPGTILSRGALQRLGQAVDQNMTVLSDRDTFADDLELALALNRLGIMPKETVDERGGQLFIALGLESERSIRRQDDPDNWFWDYSPEAKEGPDCCAERWLGTHYASASYMYSLDDMHLMQCEGAGPVDL